MKNDVSRLEAELAEVRRKLQSEIALHAETKTLLQRIEASYSRFVPDQLLKLLNLDSIMNVNLGDHIERKMTIMFSDIRDFTSLSESMTPEQNFRFINSYLSVMGAVIKDHEGVIDKYIGDAIMALFPYEADQAVQAAIAMLRTLEEYNLGRQRMGYRPVHIGIGLNTGLVMLGIIGGISRMEGTVVSDAVNLASRLESLSKNYHSPLLISGYTLYSLADPSRYCIRFLDRVFVKGKNQPQSVYEVFDADPVEIRDAKMATLPLYEEALACYHLNDIDKAKRILVNCLSRAPGDRPAQVYLQRCIELESSGRLHEGLLIDLPWKAEYETGRQDVDDQHRTILDKINELSHCVHRDDIERAQGLLDFFTSCGRNQLQMEEAMMRKSGTLFMVEHIELHRKYAADFERLKEEINAQVREPLYLVFRIQLLLVDWLIQHTILDPNFCTVGYDINPFIEG